MGEDMRNSRFSGCIKLGRYKSGDSLKRESPNEYSNVAYYDELICHLK